jgi:hypothetical protein
MEQLVSLISLGDGSTLTLDFTTGVLDSRLTFSRSTGGSYVHSDGLLYGFDTSSTSNTIGTGSKTFTISATAGVNRRYAVGDLIIASSGANNMSGSVTSYDPATQALVCNMASSTGSGTFTTWIIGNRQPRFDYDPTTLAPRGLLVEGQAVNICLNGSMAYTATAPTSWTRAFSGCTVASVDSTTFPGQKAWSISAAAIGQRDFLEQVIALAANTTYTVSAYVEAITGTVATFAYMTSLPSGASSNTVVNPSAGRISFTVTVGATAGNGTLRIGIGTATGTGVSADASVRFSHVQVEAGSGASSYIPTGASQGTRNVESCVMTGTNFSSWFNATEGTLLAHAIRGRTSDIGRIATVNDNTANESIELAADTSGEFIVVDGGSTLANITPGTVTANTAFKIAGAYKLNDVQAALGGTLGVADTAVTLPTVDRLMIGQQAGASPVYLNGTISLLKYWPTRLSNAQLQSITT